MKYPLSVAKELVNLLRLGERDLSPEAYAALIEIQEKQGLLYEPQQHLCQAAIEICERYDTEESHRLAAYASKLSQ